MAKVGCAGQVLAGGTTAAVSCCCRARALFPLSSACGAVRLPRGGIWPDARANASRILQAPPRIAERGGQARIGVEGVRWAQLRAL